MEMMQTPKTVELTHLDKVYCCICENPGESTIMMAEELDMPHENVNRMIEELKSVGLVEFELAKNSPIVKKVYPVDIKSLIPTKLKKELIKFVNEE